MAKLRWKWSKIRGRLQAVSGVRGESDAVRFSCAAALLHKSLAEGSEVIRKVEPGS